MKAWDEIWKTKDGRSLWLKPDLFVISLLPKFKEENVEKVLDLGFGVGRHTVLFSKEGFDVYGIDTSPTGLKYSIIWSEKEKITPNLQKGEMNSLPYQNDIFDLIIAWNVIYHGTTEYIQRTINEIRRCLKLNGYLLCTLISARNSKCGLGEEIEPGTFIIEENGEKSYPHHYFNIGEINHYLKDFTLLNCEEVEQNTPGSYHWNILSRLISK